MALFGAQTPRALAYELPPQDLQRMVTDDASAIAAVKALVAGCAEVESFEVKQSGTFGSRHRCVVWGGRTEVEHVLVRIFHDASRERVAFPLLCAIGEELGPKCLGRFGNGRLERWLPYHTPLRPCFGPAALWTDAVAKKLAAVHSYKPPLHLMDVSKKQPAVWGRLGALFKKASSQETRRRLTSKWAGAADQYASLDLHDEDFARRLLKLERRAPRGARVAFCHNSAARHVMFRSDDMDVAFVDWDDAASNYTALDIAHYVNDATAAPPALDDRRSFLHAYLGALFGRPPSTADVNALLGDLCFFTIVDNYLRGFRAVLAAGEGQDHVAAASLMEAQTRLRDARVQQYVLIW